MSEIEEREIIKGVAYTYYDKDGIPNVRTVLKTELTDDCIKMIADEVVKRLNDKNETYDTHQSRIFHCAVCNYGVNDIYEGSFFDHNCKTTYLIEKDKEWKYCPNCGAKIDWEKKDE